MNAETLKKLWQQRMSVVHRLQDQAFVLEQREPTADEKAAEERMAKELEGLDGKFRRGLDEAEREQRSAEAFERFQKLTGNDGPSNPDMPDVLLPNQSLAEWSKRNLPENDYRGTFDNYIRGLIHGPSALSPAEEQRALSEGTLTAGGHMVPTPVASNVIDLARSKMRVMQAGAITVPMTSDTLKVPRLTGEGSPAWHSENAAISSADLVFDAVTFNSMTLTRLVQVSIELVDDAPTQAEGVIADSFAAQIALELDRAALRGSGTAPEPRGILNQSGVTITTHGANGAAIANYDFWLDAKGVVLSNNFEATAHIQAPRSNVSLSKLKEATTLAYLQPPANMLPMLASKQVPINLTVGTSTDCSEVYTGQFDQLWIGMRTEFRLVPLRERFIDNGQYGFLAWLRADVQLAQPSAFVVDTGVRG
jgi:HK97 family phage major capsid protein